MKKLFNQGQKLFLILFGFLLLSFSTKEYMVVRLVEGNTITLKITSDNKKAESINALYSDKEGVEIEFNSNSNEIIIKCNAKVEEQFLQESLYKKFQIKYTLN